MRLHRNLTFTASALALAATIAAPAAATQGQPGENPPAPTEDELADDTSDGDGVIVVTAQRQRGSVDTDVPPVVELDARDIASYGADSLADLVAQLAPQTNSGRGRGGGRPIFLVNGQRISSFRELGRYPPEAIERVQVFPEEVALQYGFRADQRVINFILVDNYNSREVELEFGGPTEGGTASGEVELSQFVISGPRRINIAAEINARSLLTEAERDIVQTPGSQPTVPGDPDPARFRSLRGDGESYELEGSFNSAFGEGANARPYSVNLAVEQSNFRSLSGLEIVRLTAPDGSSAVRAIDDNPLTRLSRSTTVSGGGSYRQPLGEFEFDLTLNASHAESETDIDRRRDLGFLQDQAAAGTLVIDGPLPSVPTTGFDRASSRITSVSNLATLRGNPLLLPAGEVSLTLAGGYDWTQIVSDDTRTALGRSVLKRGDINGSINLNIPLASEREGFLGFLGELNLNASGNINELSDFGTLYGVTVGLNWEPIEGLTFQATSINRESAPGLSQLGDPVVQTFNVPVFDFATGDSVLATVISGGNPFLPAANQNDIKLSVNYDLDLFERASILVEYFDNSSEDTTEAFPLLTSQIEAAFPDRVTRDADGTLLVLDQRPITYAERNSRRIRYGINLFGRVGPEPEERGGPAGGPPAGNRGPGGASAGGNAAGGQGQLDPERMRQMREQFCATEPGTVPDLSALPAFIRERLTNEDGSVNMERLAQARERFCNTEGPEIGQPAAGGQGLGQAGTGAAGMFDPERLEAIRNIVCNRAEDAPPIDFSQLPEALRQRLTNEDGTINQERLAALRERVCQADGAQQGGNQSGERSGGGFSRGDGQGRWSLSLFHAIELDNTALIAPGVPLLDFLDGDASGQIGGVSRHQIELEGGVFHKGLGARLSGTYRSATRVDGNPAIGSSDLFFGDLATFDLRLFANLEEQEWLVGSEPGFFEGARFSLRLDNLFNARQEVVDGDGVTPIRFQPALIDPLGRTVQIEFRKLF